MHPPLPKQYSFRYNLPRLRASIRTSSSLMSTILKSFAFEIYYGFVTCVLLAAAKVGNAFLIKTLMKDMENGAAQDTEQDLLRMVLFFSGIIASSWIAAIIENSVTYSLSVASSLIQSSIYGVMLEKVGRYSPHVAIEHSTGAVMNYVQVDAAKFETFFVTLFKLAKAWIMLTGNMIYMYVLIGPGIASIFITLVVFSTGLFVLSKLRVVIRGKTLTLKDQRLEYLKNVIKNIKYIKMRTWEFLYHNKLSEMRYKEVKLLKWLGFTMGLFYFFDWMTPTLAIYSLFYFQYYIKKSRYDFSDMTAYLKLGYDSVGIILQIPFTLNEIQDLMLSVRRIESFLKSEEINQAWITEENQDPELAVDIKDADFYWAKEVDGKLKKKGGKAVKTTKSIKRKKPIKKSKKGANQPLIEDKTAIPQTIENSKEEVRFKIGVFDLQIRKGILTFVVGKLASGKSSLLYSILGEMPACSSTAMSRTGRISFLTQNPWIIGASLKDNIILANKYDEVLFNKVLKYSQLKVDLKEMQDGAETIVGESGQTLSGGQRARLALARCFYNQPDIMILDDPLSAVDIHVAEKLMNQAFLSHYKHTTRIISTNQLTYLRYADEIIFMGSGKVEFQGSFQEFAKSPFYKELQSNADIQLGASKDMSEEDFKKASIASLSQAQSIIVAPDLNTPAATPLFLTLLKSPPPLTLRAFFRLLPSLGGVFTNLFSFSTSLINAALFSLVSYMQFDLADAASLPSPLDLMPSLLVIVSFSSLACFRVWHYLIGFSNKCQILHSKMILSLLHSSISSFIERVPLGTVFTRFSDDLDVVDNSLPMMVSTSYLIVSFNIVNVLFVAYGGDNLIILVITAVFFFIGIIIREMSMKGKREMTEIKKNWKGTVSGWIGESITGCHELRGWRAHEWAKKRFGEYVDHLNQNSILIYAIDSWFKARILLAVLILVQLPCYGIVLWQIYSSRKSVDLPRLMLFISRADVLANDLIIMLNFLSTLEVNLISFQRCERFGTIPSEKGYGDLKKKFERLMFPKPKDYPKIANETRSQNLFNAGEVIMEDVNATYITRDIAAIKDLSFKVHAGEKIGVVGRTGAGKSSFIKLFYRGIPNVKGRITIDGIDISTLELKTLRREISVIPQEVSLFNGSLRLNLSPSLEFSNNKSKELENSVIEKMKALGFNKDKIERAGLDFHISGNGDNLSMGERQIISFMRAFLSDTKIIVLDEATAAVDLKTEEAFQTAIEADFKDRTMFIIAHRVQTILDCNRIMVFSAGQLTEFGTVQELLAIPDGEFKAIHDQFKEGTEKK